MDAHSFAYAIQMNQEAKARAETRGTANGAPLGGRRPPPRGMRPPFQRGGPRRPAPFQPRGQQQQPPRQPLQYREQRHAMAGQDDGGYDGGDVEDDGEHGGAAVEQLGSAKTQQPQRPQEGDDAAAAAVQNAPPPAQPIAFDDSEFFADEIPGSAEKGSMICEEADLTEDVTVYTRDATMIVKRLYMLNFIAPYLIYTNYMIADIFTKALDVATFVYLRKYLLNIRESNETYVSDYQGNSLTLRGKAARWWDKLIRNKH